MTFDLLAANFNQRLLSWTCVLKRIGDKVLKDDLQQGRVGFYERQVSDLPFHSTSFRVWFQIVNNVFDDRIHAGQLQTHLVPANAAQGEQIVDQQSHAAGAVLNTS